MIIAIYFSPVLGVKNIDITKIDRALVQCNVTFLCNFLTHFRRFVNHSGVLRLLINSCLSRPYTLTSAIICIGTIGTLRHTFLTLNLSVTIGQSCWNIKFQFQNWAEAWHFLHVHIICAKLKIQTSLRICAGWSESWRGTQSKTKNCVTPQYAASEDSGQIAQVHMLLLNLCWVYMQNYKKCRALSQ